MMQHHEQETRQTLNMTRPRFLHERLAEVGTTMRTMKAHGAPPEDIIATTQAKIDGLAREEHKRFNHGMNALAAAINAEEPQPRRPGLKPTTAWMCITIALCAVVGAAVYRTGSPGPLWLLVLPFVTTVKNDPKGGAKA